MLPTTVKEPSSLDADLIQSSYSIVKAQADEFTESFYQILFDKYPSVRPLFSNTDMKKQKKKLIESLDLVLVNVHNPQAFRSILIDLGQRHVKYGAVLTDYPLVGDALLQALEKHLGQDWTPDLKHAWSLAYQNIANTMAEGAKSAMKDDSRSKVSSKNIADNQNLNQESDSSSRIIFNKFIVLLSIIAALSGCAIWTLIQPQPNITPNPVLDCKN